MIKKKIKKVGLFDENFFLYLEEIDLCKRLLSSNEKIYVNNYAKIIHLGAKSSNLGFEYEKCKSWHWMWSKFYYNKKHEGYILSLIKTLPTFVFSFLKYFFYNIFGNYKKKEISYIFKSLKFILSQNPENIVIDYLKNFKK